MNNYTVDYRQYNKRMYSIMDEKISLRNLKEDLEDRGMPKEEIKANGKSLYDLAKHAHSVRQFYFATVYNNGIPHCYFVFDDTGLTVKFLDERLFWYVSMTYFYKENNQMFLSEIWVREYMYEKEDDLHDLKGDQHFQFTEKGKLWVTKETIIREGETKILKEEKEAASPVNVSQNWQKIPEFGKYDYLADYKSIIKPGDLYKSTFG